jgi:myosin heavy subunit
MGTGQVWRMVAAVLHLGNISFAGDDEAAVDGECHVPT